ncbi:MAG: hypothetical protein WC489_01240 [Patescibacteria group bacterium]
MPKDSLYLSEVAGSSEKERFPQYDCLVVCQHGQARSPAAVAALRRSGFTAASIHGGLKRMRELSEEDLTRFAARLKGTPIFCIMTEGEERHQLEFLKKMANHDLGILTVSDMDEILAWFKNKEEMNVHS